MCITYHSSGKESRELSRPRTRQQVLDTAVGEAGRGGNYYYQHFIDRQELLTCVDVAVGDHVDVGQAAALGARVRVQAVGRVEQLADVPHVQAGFSHAVRFYKDREDVRSERRQHARNRCLVIIEHAPAWQRHGEDL